MSRTKIPVEQNLSDSVIVTTYFDNTEILNWNMLHIAESLHAKSRTLTGDLRAEGVEDIVSLCGSIESCKSTVKEITSAN